MAETRGEIRGRALNDRVIQFCFLKLFSWLIYWIFAFTVILLTMTLVELGVNINSSVVSLLFQYFMLGFIVFMFLPEWVKLHATFFIIDSKDIRLCTLFLFWILLVGKPAKHISITLENMSKSAECILDTTNEKMDNLVRNLMKDEDVKKITDMLKEVNAINGALKIIISLFKFLNFLAFIGVCPIIWEFIKRILGPMQNIYSYLYSKAGKLIFITKDIDKEDRRMHPTLKILPLKSKNKRKYMLARSIGSPLPLLRNLGYYLWILLKLLLITLAVISVDDNFSRIYNGTNNTLKNVLDIDLKIFGMVLPGTSFIMKGFVNVIKDKIDMFQDQLSLKDYKMCLLPIPDSVSVFTPMVRLIFFYILNCILATYQEKLKETLLHCCYPKRQREHELVLREKILRESQRKLAQRHMAAKTTGSAVSDSKYKSYLLSYDIVDEEDLPTHNY